MLRYAKKLGRTEDLLSLALILSLVRIDPDSYLGLSSQWSGNQLRNYISGDTWGYLQTDFHRQIIPDIPEIPYFLSKNIEVSLAEYQEELIADLNELGRYGVPDSNRTYAAYLLNEVRSDADLPSPQPAERNNTLLPAESQSLEDRVLEEFLKNDNLNNESNDLTAEDVDLIEILWKQDVDLGVPRDVFSYALPSTSVQQSNSSTIQDELYEKALLEKKKNEESSKGLHCRNETKLPVEVESFAAGLQYIVDDETGEYILQETLLDSSSDPVPEAPDSTPLSFDQALSLFKFDLEDFSEDKLTDNDFTLGTFNPDGEASLSLPELPSPGLSDGFDEFDLALGLYQGGETKAGNKNRAEQEADVSEEVALDLLSEELEARLEEMIQTLDSNPREEDVSSTIMEQRWNDLTGFLQPSTAVSLDFDENLPVNPYQVNTVANQLADLGTNGSFADPSLDTTMTLGSALSTSLNVTNNTDLLLHNVAPLAFRPTANPYYQDNGLTAQNSTEGFFPSILSDEDLRLMDLVVHDSVPYAVHPENAANATLFESNTINGDSGSDSAVSSMGSERVPSISESDWIDTNASDSNIDAAQSYAMDYPTGAKLQRYEFAFSSGASEMDSMNSTSTPSGVQKKHQMFGRRNFQGSFSPAKMDSNQGENIGDPAVSGAFADPVIKYEDYGAVGGGQQSGSESAVSSGIELESVRHNHTYSLRTESAAAQRPVARDKHKNSASRSSARESSGSSESSESDGYSRDVKRARALNIPMSVEDIVNLPMDEFTERVAKYDMSEAQLSLVRDIRRRGKNKVAAQNCRKRKMDQILSLADEVQKVRDRKIRLMKERETLVAEKTRVKKKFAELYRHVFQSLRDASGRPYSSDQYSLQQSADGSILLVPRGAAHGATPIDPQPRFPTGENARRRK